jgi:FtsP/CotA-like multicopper oxidase with cupredoxin domain
VREVLDRQTLVARPAFTSVGATTGELAIIAGKACIRITDNNKLRRCASLCVVISGVFGATCAHSGQSELVEPLVCSAFEPMRSGLSDKCEITSITQPGDPPNTKQKQVKVFLEAQSKRIIVGGYRVTTENYGTYLPPVVEAGPGDTVAAHLTNGLQKPVLPSPHGTHGDPEENPTNLHYFHGGIVTPNNSRPMDARIGNGDNIYVYRKRGESFDFSVPIPDKLDGRVLEVEGFGTIEHPSGLNWYHSHLHGISSTQVMGGLSGLLSVGDALANVKAACKKNQKNPEDKSCTNSVANDTRYLKEHTDPKYVLLRDISLKDVSSDPESADGTATATWAPDERDSPRSDPCGIRHLDNIDSNDPSRHEGYCQRLDTKTSMNRVWLFTLNGQRFPKITIRRDRNSLLRMGNLSANIAYWLEVGCEEGKGCDQLPEDERKIKRLEVLSLDGVVPAEVTEPVDSTKPKANTFLVPNLLLMPASRAELYVRNDFPHEKPIFLILRTKSFFTSLASDADVIPEIQLARIILEPSPVKSEVEVALNAPVVAAMRPPLGLPTLPEAALPPRGCVRDLKPETDLSKREHRRVSFGGRPRIGWNVGTEIVRFPEHVEAENEVRCVVNDPSKGTCVREALFEPDMSASIGKYDDPNDSHHPETNAVTGVPFEAYEFGEGNIDWLAKRDKAWNEKPLKHACIFVNPNPITPNPQSHMQLWVLTNNTSYLHNFHIHQMKFRLAKRSELISYRIAPPEPSSTCDSDPCDTPNYKLFDDDSIQAKSNQDEPKADIEWHDTIPVPPGLSVFIVMSFDAKEQLGRFVYHCHILKHEDQGLMAPIEVLKVRQNETE